MRNYDNQLKYQFELTMYLMHLAIAVLFTLVYDIPIQYKIQLKAANIFKLVNYFQMLTTGKKLSDYMHFHRLFYSDFHVTVRVN